MTVIRSIGAEFAGRIFYPIAIISAVTFAISITAVVWLVTYSQWWLLLLVPIIMLLCIVSAVLAVMWLTVRTVTPVQSKPQKKAVKQFVDKLQRVSDAAQTPKVVLLFRIVRDIAAPRADGFIGTIASDTSSLTRDFADLQKLFK
jgi:hypothetical protein